MGAGSKLVSRGGADWCVKLSLEEEQQKKKRKIIKRCQKYMVTYW